MLLAELPAETLEIFLFLAAIAGFIAGLMRGLRSDDR
jgi:hypothetical protein